jgi:hypothetical protein
LLFKVWSLEPVAAAVPVRHADSQVCGMNGVCTIHELGNTRGLWSRNDNPGVGKVEIWACLWIARGLDKPGASQGSANEAGEAGLAATPHGKKTRTPFTESPLIGSPRRFQ